MKTINYKLNNNQCYRINKKRPETKGLMLHSIGCRQPSAKKLCMSFNKANVKKCVHGFIDANTGDFYKTLPWNARAWHCGGKGDNSYIGIEMCEAENLKGEKAKKQATTAYNSAVKLFAVLCKKYGLNPLAKNAIISHSEGHKLGIASNHGDPESYWKAVGVNYTMNKFRKDVKKKLDILNKKKDSKLYRVQVGAFNMRTYALALKENLRIKGYHGNIIKCGDFYRIQVGAFSNKKNAKKLKAKLKKDGFDAIIV